MSVIQRKTVKDVALLSNGSYDTGKGQAFDDYLWDTNFIPPSRRTTQFFKTNSGSQYGIVSGDIKTDVETSMEDTGKLPAGQSFLINAITASLISNVTVASDTGAVGATALSIVNAWRLLMTHSVWEIKFSNTEYSWRDSGSIFLPSVFEMASEQSTTDLGISNTQIGNYSHYNWIKVSTKVPVSELVSFAVNVTINSGVASIQTKLDNALFFLNGEYCEWRTQLKGLLLRKV